MRPPRPRARGAKFWRKRLRPSTPGRPLYFKVQKERCMGFVCLTGAGAADERVVFCHRRCRRARLPGVTSEHAAAQLPKYKFKQQYAEAAA